jgi:hypothetical protein
VKATLISPLLPAWRVDFYPEYTGSRFQIFQGRVGDLDPASERRAPERVSLSRRPAVKKLVLQPMSLARIHSSTLSISDGPRQRRGVWIFTSAAGILVAHALKTAG